MSYIRVALLSTVTLLALAIGTSSAQVPPTPPDRPLDDKVTPPGGFKPVARPINVVSAPGPVEALDAFAVGFLEPFVVQGPASTVLTIKSIENVGFGGGVSAAALFELVDVPSTVKGSGSVGQAGSGTQGSGSANPQPVSRANELPRDLSLTRDEQISTVVTLRKRLRYKGIPLNTVQDPAGFLRSVDIELQASAPATSARTAKFTVIVGRDNGPPRIGHVGNTGAVEADFPPFSGFPGENNNGWNLVTTRMELIIDAEDFTVPTTASLADAAFRSLYRVIVEYADGTKFSRFYTGLGRPQGAPPSISRTRVIVPNIGRGGFRILLANPFGTVVDGRSFTFPSNSFTSHPVASCLITGIGVDVPARAVTENSFWPPTSFQPEALPSSRACGKTYGEWDSVKIDQTKADIGIADSKLTRTPSKGSLAHNGNMPAFSCNAASMISVRIEWTAKLKIFEGECANERVL